MTATTAPIPWLTEPRRAWLYGLVAPIAALLVGYGYLSEHRAVLWVGLVGQVINGLLAFLNSPSADATGLRRAIYGLATPAGALLVAYGAVDDQSVALWLGVAAGALGNGTAGANTSTKP